MESSSSSSSIYSSQYQQAKKSLKLSQSLHSVRKSNPKPSKKPIAPLPPTPPKIYQVDPVNFRDLVQRLTGAADAPIGESKPQRLQRVAPPPLDFVDGRSPVDSSVSGLYREMMGDMPGQNGTGISEMDLLSPSSWCSFALLSPGALSNLDQSTVP